MNEQNKNSASNWRDELLRRLGASSECDVVIAYSQVACAFPSSEPNARSFDVPLIEFKQLKAWAAANGWAVELAHEMKASDDFTPVRFTRVSVV